MKALLALSFFIVGALAANDAAVRLFATGLAPSQTAGGYITFKVLPSGDVNVTVDIWGLAPGTEHGYHIHQDGDTSSVNGTAALAHFDPHQTVNHACPGNFNRHEGDMGNFTTDANGNFHGSFVRDLLTPTQGTDVSSLDPSIIGRSVIVHAAFDNCVTQPTGNSGARYLQGTIGIAENAAAGIGQSWAPPNALAVIYNTGGTKIGTAWFADNGSGAWQFYMKVGGFAPGSVHGVHIHAYGDHARLDGLSAGSHFNPASVAHALPEEQATTRHAGDLGNVVASADGYIYVQRVFTTFVLGTNAANNIIGHALIIHSKWDEGQTSQPVGNSGTRVAFGVIGATVTTFPTMETAPVAVGIARMFGTKNRPALNGTVKLSYDDTQTLTVSLDVKGLNPTSTYAIHVHEFGDISDSAGLLAGSHFNPYGALHGCVTNGTRHAGDLGSFTTDSFGNFANTLTASALLSFVGQNSSIGRAVIIHSQADDCSQPTGNAGVRWGQGVIGLSQPPGSLTQTAANPFDYPVSPFSVLRAYLQPTSNSATNNLQGWAWFRTSPTDPTRTQVFVNVTNVSPVSACHGIHVHQYGDLTALDGTSAGGHWNPAGVAHALPINSTRHAGDLGNICVDANGNGVLYGSFDVLDVTTIIGRALVLHLAQDLGYAYQPTGNTVTTRIAIGAIGIAGPSSPLPVWPLDSSSTGSTTGTTSSSTALCIGNNCSPAAAVYASLLAVLVAALLAIVLARF